MACTRTLGLSVIATIMTCGMANAQSIGTGREATGFYVSGGYNYLDFEEDLGNSESVDALTGRAGYQLTPYFSAEGEVSFGIDDNDFDFDGDEDDFDFDDNIDGDLDDVIRGTGNLGMDYLIGLFGRLSMPLSDRVDVSARAGYAFVELDSTIKTIAGNDLEFGGSDDGFGFGASASYDLTEAISLRADYTHYEFEDSNAESLGIGLQFKFAI